uniref:NADH-ubiquinone oxidoreductase chain 6 n=1 Tax=Freyastera benthophila TaxID=556872 RepID=A0A3S5XG40_9ECHI|nr:NADH dehydrogenase subunit 6 [Freyastera benthophila]AYR06728.1 NADH dehydrogenase subunit 6 [Freyastera benthophila]
MIIYFLLVLMFLGSTFVFYSLSPYYGALGLVLVAVSGCFLCSLMGLSFMALILLLIYIGGMLVVFVYSTALSAERYPVISNFKEVILLCCILILWVFFGFDLLLDGIILGWVKLGNLALIGSGVLYGNGWYYLIFSGYILFIALIVALVLTYGSEYNVLKAL